MGPFPSSSPASARGNFLLFNRCFPIAFFGERIGERSASLIEARQLHCRYDLDTPSVALSIGGNSEVAGESRQIRLP